MKIFCPLIDYYHYHHHFTIAAIITTITITVDCCYSILQINMSFVGTLDGDECN